MNVKTFPLGTAPLTAYNLIKRELEKASFPSIDESCPFVGECDTSEVAISAILNQGGRSVAFMSRTLQGSELHYPSIEKEATVIIEAVYKWRQLLAGQHFMLTNAQWHLCWITENAQT